MERELSVFIFLTNQMQLALEELEAQNIGKAKTILKDALEDAQNYAFVFPAKTRP